MRAMRGASIGRASSFLFISLLPLLVPGVRSLRYINHHERDPNLIAASSIAPPHFVSPEQQPLAPELPIPPPSADDDGARDSLSDALPALTSALAVMQSHFFELWQGTWPHAIDWTAAVMGTHLSSTLALLSRSPSYDRTAEPLNENLVDRYFSHLTAFYFGENAFSLRTQAYDDILWVVLDWISAINFVNGHDELHFPRGRQDGRADAWETGARGKNTTYFGKEWIPAFAHRARVFYDLAAKGWDTSLCGGGMVWSPYLTPYKNAITNQLWIAASVNMYLYFPGDDNSSPFLQREPTTRHHPSDDDHPPPPRASPLAAAAAAPNDPMYLRNAIEAYKWLATSNMTNAQGLYADGFHIRGWRSDRGGGGNGSIGSGRCDLRDEQVYTYNQGVLLSGLRGLWRATGARSYLEDGHRLIENVIRATGYRRANDDEANVLSEEEEEEERRGGRFAWRGMGRDGILEEACDAHASCSQNGQAFKGIFFHHLAVFCRALPAATTTTSSDDDDDDEAPPRPRRRIVHVADAALAADHERRCATYHAWIRRNARAAYGTRDADGEFGMWWGPGLWRRSEVEGIEAAAEGPAARGADYRNRGVPDDAVWRLPRSGTVEQGAPWVEERWAAQAAKVEGDGGERPGDPNRRGRGRTVETQSGGLAVLGALFGLVDLGS